MVRFRELHYKNFLASGNYDTYIDLDGASMTLIIGQNGAGKSTILDAICFCLFNKPFRKFNKGDVANSINKKDCLVEIVFTIGNEMYKVVRGVAPAEFEVYNGAEKVKITAATELQDYLEGVLGFSHKSFLQIAILGKSSFVPFMKLEAKDRRAMVEDLLDIQVFTAMNDIAKKKMMALTNLLSGHDTQLKQITSKVEALQRAEKGNIEEDQKKLVAAKEALDTNVKEKGNVDAGIQMLQKALDTEIKLLAAALPDDGDMRTKMNEMVSIRATINSNVQRLKTEILFLSDHTDCPTCKQKIDVEFREATVSTKSAKLAEYSEGIKKLDAKMSILSAKQTAAREQRDALSKKEIAGKGEINKKIVVSSTHDNEIRRLTREISALEKKLKENNTQIAAEIDTAQKEADDLAATILVDREELRYYEAIVGMLKDTGIKALVVKQYLPVINNTVNEYLKIMDFFVNIEFDDQFNEVIKSRHRDKFTYEHFSEGERLRIDLALLLTWRAVAKMKLRMDTNLLIMDEILDSSLDEAGMDGLVEILEKIYHDRNVFIISHKGDQLADKFDRVLTFQKIDNFSRLVV